MTSSEHLSQETYTSDYFSTIRKGAEVFGFIKKTNYGIEKMYLLYLFPPELHTLLTFVVQTSLTHPRKILLVVLQIGK
jgi:hypothetical protein